MASEAKPADSAADSAAGRGVERFLHAIDRFNTFIGKGAAWLIIGLMLLVCAEVFKRYILNKPTAWIFDASNMFYGTLFMMCGAYTLAQNGHVRGDFLYSSFKPRTQAFLDLILYFVFFFPGIMALVYAGYSFAGDSWRIGEHSNTTADGPPVYHFKAIIPIAGSLVALQGVAEVVRCIVCLKTGEWPSRLKDVAEADVIEQQLAGSEHVDDDVRKAAIENANKIDEAARQRGRGGE
jgi:TRAP-type mannitol/chloroaromatic compound transport system permease small subunit